MENSKNEKHIKSYHDLRVYQNLYRAMTMVLTKIVPNLPPEEKYDLGNQMRRACKAGPALIAEGFAKRYYKKNWRKYLDDCIGECNEMIHHLSICVDVYYKHANIKICKELINTYDISCKQLYNLRKSWCNFHELDGKNQFPFSK